MIPEEEYVSFLEAMSALAVGQNVSVHLDNGMVFDINPEHDLDRFFGITFRELTYSRFKLEGCGCQ